MPVRTQTTTARRARLSTARLARGSRRRGAQLVSQRDRVVDSFEKGLALDRPLENALEFLLRLREFGTGRVQDHRHDHRRSLALKSSAQGCRVGEIRNDK